MQFRAFVKDRRLFRTRFGPENLFPDGIRVSLRVRSFRKHESHPQNHIPDHAPTAFMRALSEDATRTGAAVKSGSRPLLFGFSLTRITPEQSTAVESNGNSKATPQNTRPATGAERFINLELRG
jgi:hypothetical protein